MKFLAFIYRWLPVLFRSAQKFINDYILPAIGIVDAIKTALAENTDFKKLLVEIYGDENAADAALDYVIAAIKKLDIGRECLKKETPIEIINCFLAHLKKQPKTVQKGIYAQLAAQIAKATSNESITDHELNTLVNIGYSIKQSA